MHHYSQHTCVMTFGSDTTLRHLWQEHVPLEASRYPFLMHGLLAFTALHLALSLPSRATEYARICDEHEAKALAPYRHALKGMPKGGLNALFAFSSILCMSSMAKANLRASQASGLPDRITLNDICELLYLTRGVREIKETSSEALFRGPFWVMLLGNGFHTEESAVLPHELRKTLRGLGLMVHESCVDAEQLHFCAEALRLLGRMYKAAVFFQSRGELQLSHVWCWAAELSGGFVKLLQAGFPPALVITTHFAVAMHLMREIWFVSSWGRLALNGICAALDGRLSKHTAWAFEQIATDGRPLMAGAADDRQRLHIEERKIPV
jgi:hypothetical protein